LKLAVNFVVLADGSMTGSGGGATACVTVGRLESSYDLHVRACVADSKYYSLSQRLRQTDRRTDVVRASRTCTYVIELVQTVDELSGVAAAAAAAGRMTVVGMSLHAATDLLTSIS